MADSTNELRWIRILLTIIAIPVVVIIFKTLKSIFIPLVFAVFLSFVFAPLNRFLRKKKVHISLVMAGMLVTIMLLMILSTMLITAATNSLLTGFPRYQVNLMLRMQDWLGKISEFSDQFALALESYPQFDISQMLSPGSFSISKTISDVATTTVGVGWNFILIVIFLMFIVAQDGRLITKLKKVLKPEDQDRTTSTLNNIQLQIQKYLLTKTVISLCTAVVGMILMLLFGVDFVLVCGILLFVMNFIPNIGSTIASAVPILISFLQSGLDFRTISFGVLIIGTQMLFGNVVEPKMQGQRLNLSPIMVLVSLIFWGWVWGVVGMVLAVPITSAINIMLIQLDEKNLISAIISS
ncbi:MAG: AI-2E family transporter [Candidatus Cloacimonadaceae bacterium]|jgi:predicted PurR-regulated permease PerM|nr:AI-2E family transporter [Candidatus Cloacimonadota bacterium]MDY0127126.1 AI-2E family transporter [Candidatus Cloacimonadaceae bacterium]MCB5255110.1 AI-2E family transporter [Candidatus Cloacimonadota bacterium]MCK9178909.1 AI-2E family transporter [Candidatus Cloacimonadota bacterium]MCK9243071.1 AI-2E family transporter [Candidatus Cloacimonadota bacterium]